MQKLAIVQTLSKWQLYINIKLASTTAPTMRLRKSSIS